MTAAPSGALDALAERLSHRFARPDLLREALTHASAGGRRFRRGYERLEFLGDRVLGLVIAELLFRRFPNEAEGDLTRRHAALVRREALIKVAEAIGLGDYIIVSAGEAAAGASANPSVLADACEAVIAALYLDGGLDPAHAFVARWWQPLIDGLGPAAPRDPKTTLQEWAQGRGLPLPVYRTLHVEGPPHQRQFTIQVEVEGLAPAEATAASKRAAETAAAALALSRIEGAA
ncbi:MAG: ribonuclease III [Stellaceae bacterium]